MPGLLHCRSGEIAFASLPAWQRRIWRNQAEAIPTYCTIPDQAFHDPIGKGPWTRYVDLPNNRRVPHGPTDDDWTLCFMMGNYNRDLHRYWMTHYVKRIMVCAARGNHESAAKYAGTLAHFIQDSAVPGHNTNNYLLADLFKPPKGQYWNIHKIFDDDRVPDSFLKKAHPRLLGESVAEIVFHLEGEYERMIRHSRSRTQAIIGATYEGRRRKARRMLAECMNIATEIVTSVWYTALCVAYDKIPKQKVKALHNAPLLAVPPDVYASQYPYLTYEPNIACPREGRAVPIRLKGAKANDSAFSVSGTSATIYQLPKGVYKKFSVLLGVHQSGKPSGPARFRIAIERKKSDRISIDINLQTFATRNEKRVYIQDWTDSDYLIYDSGPFAPDKPARRLELRLPPCERLILLTVRESENLVNAVWARPTLHK